MHCFYSNRTLTAKFVISEPQLYVHITDANLDERGGSLGSLLGADELEERVSGGYLTRTYKIYQDNYGYLPQYLRAIPESNNNFLGWYDSNGAVISTSTDFEERDMDAYRKQHIYAAFSGESKPADAPETVTIKLYSNKAGGSLGGKGKVGFSLGNLSYAETKVVKYGETVTVYAEGDERVGDYNVSHYFCIGFYLDSGAALRTYTDYERLHSYTFAATRDMDISADWGKYDY